MKAVKSSSLFLFLAILISMPLSCMADPAKSPNSRYKGKNSVFVPYANAKTNADLQKAPTISLGFDGNKPIQFIMDTGSVGIVATSDAFKPGPDAQNLGPAEIYYDSSGVIGIGTIWSATQQIYDPDGNLLATSNVPVFQITQVICASGATDCTASQEPQWPSRYGHRTCP